jgi:hypothetical protein
VGLEDRGGWTGSVVGGLSGLRSHIFCTGRMAAIWIGCGNYGTRLAVSLVLRQTPRPPYASQQNKHNCNLAKSARETALHRITCIATSLFTVCQLLLFLRLLRLPSLSSCVALLLVLVLFRIQSKQSCPIAMHDKKRPSVYVVRSHHPPETRL